MNFPIFRAQLKQERSTAGTLSHTAAHICHFRGAAVASAFLQAPMEGARYASAAYPNSPFNVPNFPSVEKVLAVEVQDVLSIYI